MSNIKTAMLSVLRRPGKTAILLLVIAITCSLVCGVVLVQRGVQQTSEVAKQELGATLTIGIDYEALMENVDDSGEGPDIPSLETAVIESLGARPEVKHYDYYQDIYLASSELKSYSFFEQNGDGSSDGAVTYDVSGSSASTTYVDLRGVNYAPIMAVEEGKLKINEGRAFNAAEMEQGSAVVVVSDQFAKLNNLQLGSIVSLKNEVYAQEYLEYAQAEANGELESYVGTVGVEEQVATHSRDLHLEVIGIFSLASNWSEGGESTSKSPANMSADEQNKAMMQDEIFNTLYTPIKVVQSESEFTETSYRSYMGDLFESSPTFYTPIYTLNSTDGAASFTEAAKQTLPKYYTVLSSQSIYENMTAPLQTIQTISNTSLVVVLLAALALMSLVIVLSLRDRRHELGIYSALGRAKVSIVVQILVEVMIVAIVGLAIAVFAGIFIANALSDVIFASQFNADALSESSEQMMNMGIYGEQALIMGGSGLESVIADHGVSMSLTHILLLLGAGIATVLLSCVLPIVYLLRLKPKKILM